MGLLELIIIIGIIGYIISKKKEKNKKYNKNDYNKTEYNKQTYNQNKNKGKIYQYKSKYILTLNEKNEYKKIKAVTDKLGYTTFTKVRLWDIIEPLNKNDYGSRGKIQSKHIDFVICDKNLIARWIIEIDDASHDRPDRKERDKFVDEIVTKCGYKIYHSRCIMIEELENFLNQN